MTSTMPRGDISGVVWQQVFTEDFDTDVPVGSFPGSVYKANWRVYNSGWKDTTKVGTYRPEQCLSVTNSTLQIHPHFNPTTNEYVVATVAPLIFGKKDGLLYGRFALRWRVDVPEGKTASGFKFVPLLWPDSEKWPQDGEIDFPEGNFDETIRGYMHYQNGASAGDQHGVTTKVPMTGAWHITETIWTPRGVQFKLDGEAVLKTPNRVPNTPMHWDIQQETSTWGVKPTPNSEAIVSIDWVTAYQHA